MQIFNCVSCKERDFARNQQGRRKELQAQIMSEKIVQSIVECQKKMVGWQRFSWTNRNAGQYENQETGVIYCGKRRL